ncbi:MAG: polysaccharide pyruvyl transferase family protein [Alistipes sp.]|nr:polysaccharide pyruvyl transferase family protein [Alistipes sp.]
MKIGILTLPLHTNYGGILQAYALQTILERMGHDVVVFDTPNKIPIFTWKLPIKFVKRCFCKFILQKPTKIFYEQWYNKTYPVISQYTQQFIDGYINRLEVNSFKCLRSNQFDVFVVGSDQVWRPIYFSRMFSTKIENAFLDFAKKWDVTRISYAASFGTEGWEYREEQTKKCGELLQLFDFVSVREESGVHLCKKMFNVDAYHVLDPTMLLESKDYFALIRRANSPKSLGNMLCYILDSTEEKVDIINQIAKERNLVPFRVNCEDVHMDSPKRIQPPVESWLRGFYDAKFVVTDSFHACVFSILFKKPFIVIGNKKRGMARFKSLLAMFGLQNRLIDSFDISVVCEEIDWNSVYQILEEKRVLSLSLLSKKLI